MELPDLPDTPHSERSAPASPLPPVADQGQGRSDAEILMGGVLAWRCVSCWHLFAIPGGVYLWGGTKCPECGYLSGDAGAHGGQSFPSYPSLGSQEMSGSDEDGRDPFVLDEQALRGFLVVAPWWGMWNGKGWRLAHPLRVAHDLAHIGGSGS